MDTINPSPTFTLSLSRTSIQNEGGSIVDFDATVHGDSNEAAKGEGGFESALEVSTEREKKQKDISAWNVRVRGRGGTNGQGRR